jgi:hypothetical protein
VNGALLARVCDVFIKCYIQVDEISEYSLKTNKRILFQIFEDILTKSPKHVESLNLYGKMVKALEPGATEL